MKNINFQILKKLCSLHGPSGEEGNVKAFLIKYINENSQYFSVTPKIIDHLQDNLILVFGKPKTVIFAHMDTVGFTARYTNELVPVGSPSIQGGETVTGRDSLGQIECKVDLNARNNVIHDFGRAIDRGTSLVYKPNFRESDKTVRSPYLDNRLGVYMALQIAHTLKNGIIAFSTWEEHGGGSVPVILNYIHEHHKISQSLICDITWITEGVQPEKGVVISMRDRNIPRREFVDKIINIATKHGVPYQLEVEGAGSSDGREVQQSPYPIDWCFIGPAEDNVHSPNEEVSKYDISACIELYQLLMDEL